MKEEVLLQGHRDEVELTNDKVQVRHVLRLVRRSTELSEYKGYRRSSAPPTVGRQRDSRSRRRGRLLLRRRLLFFFSNAG